MTPAVRFLEKQNIPFEISEYDHGEKGALFASEAIGMPLEQTIKTLVIEVSKRGHLVVLMPGSKTIAFKKLARVLGAKRAAMVSTAMAERLTGYAVGGISPFGMRQSLSVLMDAALLSSKKVAINGGKRGLMLIMDPYDILKATGAKPIAV